MTKYKKVTTYIGLTENNDWYTIYHDDDTISRWYYTGRYPKEVIEKIPEDWFKTINWDLGVVTFKVKVE